MRWVFLTLVFANLVYFGYQWRQATDATKPIKAPHPDALSAGGVRLLSERNGRSDRDHEAERVLQNPELATEGMPDESETGNEEPVQPLTDAPGTGALPEISPVVVNSCWRIGDYSDLAQAQDISERLTAVDLDVEIKAIDAPTGDYDYRVVIPPMPSMQEAFRRLRELKGRNIDSYVMTQGENAQGISLGLFSTETAAIRHRQQMAGLGYESVVRPIARVSRGFWLFTAPGVIPESMMRDLLDADEGVEVSETDCLN